MAVALDALAKQTIQSLIDTEVLIDIDGPEFRNKCKDGMILTYCGDGDQSLEFQLHLLSILLGISMDDSYSINELIDQIRKKPVRMHQHGLNGGALRLNKQIPVPPDLRIDRQLAQELRHSRGLKKIPTLVLTGHTPCGMAYETNLTVADSIWHLITTARNIENKFDWDHNRIMLLFHVDFGGGKKRTYFIKKKKKELVYS